MAIHLDRQRPPKKKMGRHQRRGSKSNPRTGVQWANWLDYPGSGGGGGGAYLDPHIDTVAPTSVVGGTPTVITVTGTNFDAGAVIEFNNAPATTTVVAAGTSLSASLTAPGTSGTVTVTVRNANNEESNNATITITA